MNASSSPHAQHLARLLDEREALVGVVGLGAVGLPMAAALVEAGFSVLGLDRDTERVAALGGAGRSSRRPETDPARQAPGQAGDHQKGDLALHLAASDRFEVTGNTERLGEPDVVLICVPTPLTEDRRPDLSHVEHTTRALAATLRPGQLVVLESTTWPGTTREVLRPLLETSGLVVGREVFLAFAPERVDPGRTEPSLRAIPRVVGALDDDSRTLAARLYATVQDRVVEVSSAEVAESAKLLENIYRAVNIALVNELKMLFTTMGLDVHEVIEAAATKPFGFQAFRPGPGLGGHCIPVDPFYLAHRAREVGHPTRFVELAGEINRSVPAWVVQRTVAALRERGREPEGAAVLLLGVAYKPDVDDVRESPSFELMERLSALGATVDFHDPHVPRLPAASPRPGLDSTPLTTRVLEERDVVILATDHSCLDLDLVVAHAPLVVDTRGVLRGRGDHIVLA